MTPRHQRAAQALSTWSRACTNSFVTLATSAFPSEVSINPRSSSRLTLPARLTAWCIVCHDEGTEAGDGVVALMPIYSLADTPIMFHVLCAISFLTPRSNTKVRLNARSICAFGPRQSVPASRVSQS